MRRAVAALVMLGVFGLGEPSWAQSSADDTSRAEARKLGYDGTEAYNAGDYAVASERLEQAYLMLAVPSLGLWSARALSKLGRLVEASERYLAVAKLPLPDSGRDVHEVAQREAAAERALLLPRIPTVTIEANGRPGDAVTKLDGVILPQAIIGTELPLNPGPHRLAMTSQARGVEREFAVREGEKVRFLLELPAAAPPPPVPPLGLAPRQPPAPRSAQPQPDPSASGLRTAGWVSIGIGGAGILLGAIAGGVAIGQNADLDDVCRGDVCPPSSKAEVDSYATMRAVSTVGFIVGGVGLATGAVFVLVPSSAGGAAVEAHVRPGVAAIVGVF